MKKKTIKNKCPKKAAKTLRKADIVLVDGRGFAVSKKNNTRTPLWFKGVVTKDGKKATLSFTAKKKGTITGEAFFKFLSALAQNYAMGTEIGNGKVTKPARNANPATQEQSAH